MHIKIINKVGRGKHLKNPKLNKSSRNSFQCALQRTPTSLSSLFEQLKVFLCLHVYSFRFHPDRKTYYNKRLLRGEIQSVTAEMTKQQNETKIPNRLSLLKPPQISIPGSFRAIY